MSKSSGAVTSGLLADYLPTRLRKVAIHVDRELELAPQLGRVLDYGTVADLVIDTSARLAAAGAHVRARVAIVKKNGLDIPVLALACQRIGAVPVLISSALRSGEAAELLDAVVPELMITDRETLYAGALSELDPELFAQRVCVVDQEGAKGLPEPLTPTPTTTRPRSGGEPVLVTHSSGTTGTPKLVVQSADSFEATVAINRRLARMLRLGGPIAVHMSLVHLRAMAGVAALMRLGPPLLVITENDPEAAIASLAQFKPSAIEAHPASFVDWEPYAAAGSLPFERVKYFFSNFDAVHPRTIKVLLRASRRRLPMYMHAYGQSETGPITTRADCRLTAEHADGRCVGFPIPGYSHVRIVKNAGPHGRTGTIEVRSNGLAIDYMGRTDLYESKHRGDWWDMGDVGYRTRFGCLHLMDREVDAVDGLPSLLAIEDALMEALPQLREAVLIPTDQGPPLPVLITYDGTQVADEQWRACTAGMPALDDPLSCSYDAVPRTATGKVQRLRMQELLRSGIPLGETR